MKGQGLNDLPRCELERRSSHHKGDIFRGALKKQQLKKEINAGLAYPFAGLGGGKTCKACKFKVGNLLLLGHDSPQSHPPKPSFRLITSPSFDARSSVPNEMFWAAASFFISVIGRSPFASLSRKNRLA